MSKIDNSRLRPDGEESRKKIMDYLKDYRARHKISPTVAEIAHELETNKSNINYHLHILERTGEITMQFNIPRSVVPVNEFKDDGYDNDFAHEL